MAGGGGATRGLAGWVRGRVGRGVSVGRARDVVGGAGSGVGGVRATARRMAGSGGGLSSGLTVARLTHGGSG